jgi:hypothetical protein
MFNILAAVSLLLCVAIATLWVSSFWFYPEVSIQHEFWADDQHWIIKDGFLRFRRNVSDVGWAVTREDFTAAGTSQRVGGLDKFHREHSRSSEFRWALFSISPTQLEKIGPDKTLRFRSDQTTTSYRGQTNTFSQWQFPLVLPAAVALSLTMPLIWLKRYQRRRRRHLSGHCVVCNYDLRATPDRCPECGTVPAPVIRFTPRT